MATYSTGQELGRGAYSMLPFLFVSFHKSKIRPIGIVYEGKNSEGDAVAAIKKSRVTASVAHTLLRHEACALLILGAPHKGFPRVYAWGRSQWFEYLALDLLGPSLSEMLGKHGGQFSIGSVLLLTIQMVRLLV